MLIKFNMLPVSGENKVYILNCWSLAGGLVVSDSAFTQLVVAHIFVIIYSFGVANQPTLQIQEN